jgi:LysM repeat protein
VVGLLTIGGAVYVLKAPDRNSPSGTASPVLPATASPGTGAEASPTLAATATATATATAPATRTPTPQTALPTAPPTVTTATRVPPTATASATPDEAATPAPAVHVVADGETLAIIAARYGVSIDAIVTLNALTDPDFIYVGEVLRIPAAPSR